MKALIVNFWVKRIVSMDVPNRFLLAQTVLLCLMVIWWILSLLN